jgi:hypothetical protein
MAERSRSRALGLNNLVMNVEVIPDDAIGWRQQPLPGRYPSSIPAAEFWCK